MGGSWPLILALWGAGLGAAMQYAKFANTFDLLGVAYPESDAALGWLVSMIGVTGVVLGAVAAMLVARIRYRRALLGALWLGAAVSVGQALLPPLPVQYALRLLEGLSHLGIVVAAPTLVAVIATEGQRGLALSLWGTFFGVAFAAMAVAGRPLAIHAGLPSLFALHGVYMVGFALYLGPRLRSVPQSQDAPALTLPSILSTHRAIYGSTRICAPAIGWLFYTFYFVALLTVLPPFLDPAVRTFVIAAFPLVGIAVSMTLGVALLRYLPAVSVVILGFGASALCTVWLVAVPAGALPCLALAASMGLIQGASFASVPQLNASPLSQSQANGAMAQMGNLGNTLGLPVMTLALGGWGYVSLPILGGAAFALGLGAHLFLARQRRKI